MINIIKFLKINEDFPNSLARIIRNILIRMGYRTLNTPQNQSFKKRKLVMTSGPP